MFVQSTETKVSLEKDIEEYIDNKIKAYPVRVIVDGQEVHYDDINYDGGGMHIILQSPFYVAETGKTLNVEEEE